MLMLGPKLLNLFSFFTAFSFQTGFCGPSPISYLGYTSLTILLFSLHPSDVRFQNLRISMFFLLMPFFSIEVLVVTFQTVIWFTLSIQMLGFPNKSLSRGFIFLRLSLGRLQLSFQLVVWFI